MDDMQTIKNTIFKLRQAGQCIGNHTDKDVVAATWYAIGFVILDLQSILGEQE